MHNNSPIFIHSLFRSGSTWLFDRFRNSSEGYWCYQEPYHEALINLKSQPNALIAIHRDMAKSLRHPQLNFPYFQEFYQIRESISDKFEKCISFDSFFDPNECESFFPYTDTLIAAAKGRPVLQCCRSFGRARHLKERYEGIHIHLWRNPRDQWLSYQVNDFFDTTSLAILNAKNPPELILQLRQELGFQEIRSDTFQNDWDRLSHFPVNSRQRYLLFYALWLYSLIENKSIYSADINIDKLTEDAEYNQTKTEELKNIGIKDVSLSGCTSPTYAISDSEKPFYEDIEQHVEKLLRRTGYTAEAVENALQHRETHQPKPRFETAVLLESAQRARTSAIRYADNLAASRSDLQRLHTQAEKFRSERNQLRKELKKVREAEKLSQLQAAEAMAHLEQIKADATRIKAEAFQVMADAQQAKAEALQMQANALREQFNKGE